MKLIKQKYYNANGEEKVNCYHINICKKIVDKTDLKDKEIKVYAKDNKIIIEKENNNEKNSRHINKNFNS